MSASLLDRPEESADADITLITRGITVSTCVEVSGASVLVVRPPAERYVQQMGVKVGDPVEIFWQGGQEERTLPAEVVEVENGVPRWHLTVTGPSTHSQRRKAVRCRVELPVQLLCAGAELTGDSIDLSEAGMRAVVDGWGLPPEPGSSVLSRLAFDDGLVEVEGKIVRQQLRGARWTLSVRFDGAPERTQDRLRRRVFQALREERAREES